MRWLKGLERYGRAKRPILRVVNPRVGTSIIPLDKDDDQIFYQYLTNKIHALHFEGSELQLTDIIHKLRDDEGFTIQKMRTTLRRGKGSLMLLHLKFPNDVELRRLIKLT